MIKSAVSTPFSYQNTPEGILYILKLFQEHRLSYLLFKCEHIFAGKNKNVDILFETEPEYHQAAFLLEQQGFVLRFSEEFEKYKLMYCGFVSDNNNLNQNNNGHAFHSFHLHREIAWHGMKALNKEPVFQRKKTITPFIIVPSPEDYLLIHAAHVVFENFKITEKERKYFDLPELQAVHREYLQQQTQKNNWEAAFWKVAKKNKVSEVGDEKLPFAFIAGAWAKKLLLEPATGMYVGKKVLKKIFRIFRFFYQKRKGVLISFSGVNGSGKTTLAKKTLEAYLPLTTHLATEQQYYYFGWKPDFFITRWISALLKKKKKKLFQEIAVTPDTTKHFLFPQLFQEALFLYLFFEFFYRYRKRVLPFLNKGAVVITDRYFYDIYGQYPYAKQSRVMKYLLKIFPAPDATYILDSDVALLAKRDKAHREKELTKTTNTKRKVLPLPYLQQQREQYLSLASLLGGKVIKNDQQPRESDDSLVACQQPRESEDSLVACQQPRESEDSLVACQQPLEYLAFEVVKQTWRNFFKT